MIVEVIVLLLAAACLWDYLQKRRRNRFLDAAGIHGSTELPLIGHAYLMVGESPETAFDMQKRLINKYGRNIRMWTLQQGGFLTTDAKMIEAVLSSQQVITKNNLYNLLQGWLGTGLLLSTGKKWFTRRKIITPTFHFKILEQFVEIFDHQTTIMVEQLYAKADGKTVIDMFPVVCLAALDIITETSMGVKINAQRNPDIPYVKSVRTVSQMTAERFMNPLEMFDFSMRLLFPHRYRTLVENIKSMHNFTDRVIAERRDALQKSIADGTNTPMLNDDDDVGSKRRMALLDVLLQATVDGAPLSNEDIREEVDTFMFEGHDTTTSGISFTMYLIGRHPEVQARLVKEIQSVFGTDKTRPVDMRSLNDLKYLECVIKESLRLYPPVPMIGRVVTQDTELDGKMIAAGTGIILLTYNAMRDPEYFPDPEKFNPDRFNATQNNGVGGFTYTPFSAGPRNCIGQKFAMLEMKSAVSKILRHFEVLPLGAEVKPVANIILRSTTGMNVGLRPRRD